MSVARRRRILQRRRKVLVCQTGEYLRQGSKPKRSLRMGCTVESMNFRLRVRHGKELFLGPPGYGPHPPVGELLVSEPTPIATGCEAMPS
jgi:hypothetical protein